MEKGAFHLRKSTIISLVLHSSAVGLSTAILFLFVALTYAQITLPHYTTRYAQKDTQQLINLIVAVLATVFGILLSHCRRLTNEAEMRSELRNKTLTIPRLHVHFEAAGGSKAAMVSPALYNKTVWKLVRIYLLAMFLFGFLNSVLSVIFVIEAVISNEGQQIPIPIPLSIDIPETWKGQVVDPCTTNVLSPDCAYELAINALSSQLITSQPYTISGVTFEGPNGTMGLPYYAMKHFSEQVNSSPFEEERRSYCLPVLDPHLISCKEAPLNQSIGETIDDNLVQYRAMDISGLVQPGTNITVPASESMADLGTFQIVVDYPSSEASHITYRSNANAHGTMAIVMNPEYTLPQNPPVWTVIGTTDGTDGGYASKLYHMMYGHPPEPALLESSSAGTFFFVAKCEFQLIEYRDNYLSSWRQVDFTLKDGISTANVTETRCPNARGSWTSGFKDLLYALQGASNDLSSTDGYSKLFNLDSDRGSGSPIFANMSALDATVNQIYHIIQTFWTQQSYTYAMQNQSVHDQPIMVTDYPHQYIFRMTWTPATWIGLCLSILITLCTWILATRWVIATYHFHGAEETWNLLRPIDLMAYTLAAYKDLSHDLNTEEDRQNVMRGKTVTILREYAVEAGTENLISLVDSHAEQSLVSNSTASDAGMSTAEKHGEGIGVAAKEAGRRGPSWDLERGT